ncbi:MAG: Mrr restriction system protein [Prevotella sp.]|jgi:restriction system protein|nr:Mrr restriction system protein [Prevotella sp.]
MAKEQFSRTKACATKTLYAVMKEMIRRGGSIPAKEIYPWVNDHVELTAWEKEPAGKMGYIRWTNSFQFYSIDYQKAGFIIKKNGTWYITPEGEKALKKNPEEVMNIANAAYHEWRRLNPKDDNPTEEPTDETVEKDNAVNLDLLESDARDGIRKYIISKSPYEFQDLVAALLRAMGYHTPFVAPKGKDGGIDIIAYLDPLGAQTPRIKVQVKHKPETAIGASDVRALSGVLKTGDIALFVTSGTYSTDARNAASGNDKFIRLIDGDDFIEMWQEYYDKMSDDDKNMLPLKRISFLGNND